MPVHVLNDLPGYRAVVHQQVEAFSPGYRQQRLAELGHYGSYPTAQLSRRIDKAGIMIVWNDEKMSVSQRTDVQKRKNLAIVVDDDCGDISRNDLAEDTVRVTCHDEPPASGRATDPLLVGTLLVDRGWLVRLCRRVLIRLGLGAGGFLGLGAIFRRLDGHAVPRIGPPPTGGFLRLGQ